MDDLVPLVDGGSAHDPGSLLRLLGRKPRLLLVDDQPLNIQALYQVFSADYQVFMSTQATQALGLCRDRQPDLLLLDVEMPGMDGYELCRELKRTPDLADIPVIFVTAHQDAEAETRGLEVGAVDFISKPFNAGVVRARVRAQLSLKLQTDLLRRLAFLDGLTGLYNRRHFDERFELEFQRGRRSGAPLSLVLADVDFFKNYNDHYGHLAGDDCLRRVATTLKDCLKRPGDLLSRFGGEEFACVLPETDLAGALAVAMAMEQAVREQQMPHEQSDASPVVTISLGVASVQPHAGLESAQLITTADEQLYRAKAQGRARACAQQL
ncbi:diguanylate cyclase [Pelomonas sp. SE-A7]|uniref:diguanylate cyclase n=1 Tax=Pelomonas sp. SE-A7 TaxID=3054953 RepID=UPI00259CFCD7|nr:diguanylate cyclase [Pelomonas sp. SE-A7]MDM4764449.1 diguanylate cyclase [Pelomonas sp. SE-A7]